MRKSKFYNKFLLHNYLRLIKICVYSDVTIRQLLLNCLLNLSYVQKYFDSKS